MNSARNGLKHANVIAFEPRRGLPNIDGNANVEYPPQLSELSTDIREEKDTVVPLSRRTQSTRSSIPDDAPSDAAKREFGRKLYRLMIDKGWNQSDLARAAAKHTSDGKFGRDNVSGYIRGLRLPGATHLSALTRALGVTAEDLVGPPRPFGAAGTPPADIHNPEFDMKSLSDGMVWLRINQAVSWDVARKIMDLLKE